MEFDILSFLIGAGIGVLIALKMVQVLARGIIKKLTQDLENVDVEAVETIQGKKVVDAVITKEKDTFYLFQKDNDLFLAQGKTLEEIHTALASRFKDTVVRVDKVPDELKQKTV